MFRQVEVHVVTTAYEGGAPPYLHSRFPIFVELARSLLGQHNQVPDLAALRNCGLLGLHGRLDSGCCSWNTYREITLQNFSIVRVIMWQYLFLAHL